MERRGLLAAPVPVVCMLCAIPVSTCAQASTCCLKRPGYCYDINRGIGGPSLNINMGLQCDVQINFIGLLRVVDGVYLYQVVECVYCRKFSTRSASSSSAISKSLKV